MEGCGSAVVTVIRTGPDMTRTIFVDYKTIDGSASAGSDFEYQEGTLCFKVSYWSFILYKLMEVINYNLYNLYIKFYLYF